MRRRTGPLIVLGAIALFLYLWPALQAPVVLWSDSMVDLDWARRGVGIVNPIPRPPPGEAPQLHPAKPAYLLFLRAVLAVAPAGKETRTVVVVQSLLLWSSIVGTAILLVRRRGAVGVVFLVVVMFFLRLRETASAVMPEALAAALLLPIAAILLDPPKSRGRGFLLGIGIAILFWVRPNVGGITLVLALEAAAGRREHKAAVAIPGGFAVLFLPIWFVTRPTQQGLSMRGLSHSLYEASVDYYWVPHDPHGGIQPRREEVERHELARAKGNWAALLRSRGPDVWHQLFWRTLHGLAGTELSAAPAWSRIASPFAILAAISLILGGVARRNPVALVGFTLLALLIVQNLALGSNPRFVLPFLPVLFLVGLAVAFRASLVTAGVTFVGLTAIFAMNPQPLEWEWGRIERAGVTIRQRIARGALPRRAPATLHVRIAPPLLPSAAHLEVHGPNDRLLYSSLTDRSRQKPAITIDLPQVLLDVSAVEPIEVRLSSSGSYGETQYLLFPVLPPPWRRSASRDGSAGISPSTGIARGSLDWWAHPGVQ